jgi:hypothetical protein
LYLNKLSERNRQEQRVATNRSGQEGTSQEIHYNIVVLHLSYKMEEQRTKLSRKNAREHLLEWKFMIGAAAKSLGEGRGMLGHKIMKGYARPVGKTGMVLRGGAATEDALLKMQSDWDDVDCMLQGIIANNIASDLIGVYQEHETAYAQYTNIVAIVERATVGNKDEAELKMRCYMQMNDSGEIAELEEYLARKQELICVYESIMGKGFSESQKVVWFLKGLSAVHFPTWPYEWEKAIESGETYSMIQMLEQARGTDNRRKEGVVDFGQAFMGSSRDAGNHDERKPLICYSCSKKGTLCKRL